MPGQDGTTVHDLANHVGALLLGLEVLCDEDDLPDHARGTLRALLAEARAAAAVVDALQPEGEAPPAPDRPRR